MDDATAQLWLKKLDTVRHADDDAGETMLEIAQLMGVSPATAQRRLKPAVADGRLIVGTRTTVKGSGAISRIPVYRWRDDDGTLDANKIRKEIHTTQPKKR